MRGVAPIPRMRRARDGECSLAIAIVDHRRDRDLGRASELYARSHTFESEYRGPYPWPKNGRGGSERLRGARATEGSLVIRRTGHWLISGSNGGRALRTGVLLLTTACVDAAAPIAGPVPVYRIVYDRSNGIGSPTQLYEVNSDGLRDTNLSHDASVCDGLPSWSPDGKRFLFLTSVCGGSGQNIGAMNADGTGRLIITSSGNVVFSRPSWSPDGTKIAFTQCAFEGGANIGVDCSCPGVGGGFPACNVFVMNADGTGQTQLTDIEAVDAVWSPDGRKIAVVALGEVRSPIGSQVLVINVDGSGAVNVSDDTVGALAAAWAPDGDRLAFISERDPLPHVYIVDADGSNLRRLTNVDEAEGRPAWSPDGTRIAFSAAETGAAGKMVLVHPDGSGFTTLVHFNGAFGDPVWSSDSKYLAFNFVAANVGQNIYAMTADGRSANSVTNSTAGSENPAWQPGGPHAPDATSHAASARAAR
jgi:Tol biopolymer transport system component